MKILAIGNSFSQDATRYLEAIASSAGEPLFVRNLYIGGCSLERHVKNFETNEKDAYAYEKNAEAISRISLPEALAKEEWDLVTVQQVSTYSGIYGSYIPHLPILIDRILTIRPHARIVFHRTWAYERNATTDTVPKNFVLYGSDTEKMHKAIMEATDRITAEYSLPVIPVGDAVMRAKCDPLFDVRCGGISLHSDGYHLTHDYGRYLAALVWFKFITQKSPDAVSYLPEGADPALISRLKQFV